MIKWEYRQEILEGWNNTAQLNVFGDEGWELVAVKERVFFFKRQKEQSSNE
jgi:hypothetical protein